MDDPWLVDLVSRAETSFLATRAPDGRPCMAHRGGPPGFLRLAGDRLIWPEYVGDGVLTSAGNVRSTGAATMLVVDLESGDAAELSGNAQYRTVRRSKRDRGLERHSQPFPVQGEMVLAVERARHLHALLAPRTRLVTHAPVTSSSTIDEQAPR
jgi:hypothetical protein